MKKLYTALFTVTALLLLMPIIALSQSINQNSSQYSNNVDSLAHKKITQAIIKKKKINNGTVITNKAGGGEGGGGGAGGGGCTNTYVLDRDGDGYYVDISTNQCNSPGTGWVIKTTQQPGDCDDNDATINPATQWVLDADGDGYYSGDPVTQCGSPDGDGWVLYSETSNEQPGDCNDNNASVNPATTWVLDNDLDGYYTGDPVTQCTSPGARWVIKTNQQPGDCDDNNPNVNPENEWVFDADGDGYYSGDPIKQCYNPGGSWVLLAGSREQPNDCDDYNYAINPATIWVLDADNDGYYTGDPVTQCTSPGDGYVIKTTQQPGDCMDNNAAVHPGAAEICGNGIDDNCNGEIDEGCVVETFTITADLVVHGSISLNPGSTVDYGGTVTATITPDPGYSVINVIVDGVPVGAQTTYTFSNVTANHTIIAETALLLYQITSTPFAFGSITPTKYVDYGNAAVFLINADPGYYITDVIVDGASVGAQNSYTFLNVTSNHTITATAAIQTYTITTSAGVHGSITPSINNATLFYPAPITITPDAGYHVADVLVDGSSVGAVTNYTFNDITANHTISATFTANAAYTIKASSGANGNISPSGTISIYGGSDQTFVITANTGYHVSTVKIDGISVGAVPGYNFTGVASNHTISASFAINTYVITASQQSNGTISPANTATVNYGSNKTYTIKPAAGYSIQDVVVDGNSVGAVSSYTFTSVAANHTISASFTINSYTITSTAGENGSISPAGNTSVNYGGTVTYAVTPANGYHVAGVIVDGLLKGTITKYTFSNVKTNHTISATFGINAYNITSSAGANGNISPNGVTAVNYGTSENYTITPNTGYTVSNVVIDGTSIAATNSYTFSNVVANHRISASFICVKPASPIIAGPATVNKQQDNLAYTVSNPQTGNSYTWTVPSGATISSGQGTSDILVKWGNASGKVGCTASNSCSNAAKATYAVTIGAAFSNTVINESTKANAMQIGTTLKVNPNPVQDKAKITFTVAQACKCSIQLRNVTGKVLIVAEVNAVKGVNEINLDVSHFASGTYFVSLIDNKEIKTLMLIKAK